MSFENDHKWMTTNPGVHPKVRRYFGQLPDSYTNPYGPATGVYDVSGDILIGGGPLSDTTIRSIIQNSKLTDITGDQIRVRFISDSNGMILDSVCVGPAVVAQQPAMVSATPVTIDGGTTVITLGASTTKWSDWIDYSYVGTVDFIISAYLSASRYYGSRAVPPTGPQGEDRTGNFACTLSGVGFSDSGSNEQYFIDQIEVRSAV